MGSLLLLPRPQHTTGTRGAKGTHSQGDTEGQSTGTQTMWHLRATRAALHPPLPSHLRPAGPQAECRQGKAASQPRQGAALQNLLQTKINLFTLPNQRNLVSSLWRVIPSWFSHEAAKENVRFVGWVPGGFGCCWKGLGSGLFLKFSDLLRFPLK